MQRLSIGLILLLAISCQSPPKLGGHGATPAHSEADAQAHFDAARALLGDAYFQHRDDVDVATLLTHIKALDPYLAQTDRWEARSVYLSARLEALRGNYRNALAQQRFAVRVLEPELADELNALAPYWKAMRYAHGEGVLLYDEDTQVREPGGLLMQRPALTTERGKHLFAQAEALFQNAQLTAMGALSQQREPAFTGFHASTDQLLREAFCADAARGCPEAKLLSARSAVAIKNREDAERLALEAAEGFRAEGRRALEQHARLLACDVAVVATGDPYELNLHPLAAMETTIAIQRGRPLTELMLPTPAAILDARACYAAAVSVSAMASTRVSAELDAREGYLAWAEARFAEAGKAFGRAERRFAFVGERRAAFRALVAQASAEHLAGGGVRAVVGAINNMLDDGPVMSAERLLERVALFAQHARNDARASRAVFETAIQLARYRAHTQRLGVLLGASAQLLDAFGQQRERLLLLEEASTLHGPYREAIPNITLLASDADKGHSMAVSLLTEYEQVASLVQGYLQRGDTAAGTRANARLRALEAQGVFTQAGVLAPRNETYLAFAAGDFGRGLALARETGDRELEALALLFGGQGDEMHAIASELVQDALAQVSASKQEDTAARTLELQRQRALLERAVRLYLRAERSKDAKRVFDQGERAFGTRTMFASASAPYERDHVLAQLAAGLGRTDRAERSYRAALQAVRAGRPDVDDQTAYIALDYTAFLLKSGQVERGLRELERVRARERQRTLLASAALIGATLEPQNPSSDQQLESLMPAVAKQLASSKTTLLVYYAHGNGSSVVVLRPRHAPVARALPIEGHPLAPLIERWSAELESGDVGWQERARALHALLVAPVADLLPLAQAGSGERPRLGIIPFGDTHRVPFHALSDGTAPLVAQHDIFYVPSLLGFAHGRPASEGVRSVRALGFNGERLKHAEDEAQAIDPQALTGERATGEALFSLLEQPGTTHVAAHAELNPDNPLRSMLRLADTELQVFELRGRPMKADVVSLSACDTTGGQRLRADELAVFATTFLENGAGSLIATGWPIDDELNVLLMKELYAGLHAGAGAVRALNEAQRKALATGGARAHPKQWAPFWIFAGP